MIVVGCTKTVSKLMSKIPHYDLQSADSSASRSYRRCLRASLTLAFPLVIIVLIAAFPWLYEMKTKAGIDLVPRIHAGTFLSKYTHGLVKCEWLYPYDCTGDLAGQPASADYD